MNRGAGSLIPVASLVLAVPIVWLSGTELANLPDQLYNLQNGSPLDWLLPLALGILLLGFLLSRLAAALNPAALRALLSLEQCRWLALLSTALVCVTWTGLQWSRLANIPVAFFFWGLLAGASLDIFVLTWLALATRAAAAARPLDAARELAFWMLRIAGGGLVALYVVADLLIRLQPQPNLFLIMLVVSLVAISFLVPPAIGMASAAALFSGISRRGADDVPDAEQPEPPITQL
jgi:hypothetical protein